MEIVFPKNNEEEFLEIASKLGIKKIIFIYNLENFKKENEKLKSLNQKDIEIESGIIVNQKNLKKSSNLSKFLVAKSSPYDRFLIESKKIKLIYGFEELSKKDFMHQRASGFNHVIAELAKKNNVMIGFSYNFSYNPIHILIGRITQNLVLCRKYKCKIVFASFSEQPLCLRQRHDVESLIRIMA